MRNQKERICNNIGVFNLTAKYRALQILLAPNFIGPPVRLALRASNSFCRINFLSSRFFLASSNLDALPEFSSNGSNSVSFQLLPFRLCKVVACVSVLVPALVIGESEVDAPASVVGTHGSDGEASSASASYKIKINLVRMIDLICFKTCRLLL